MAESTGLLPIVLGIGLTVLSAGAVTAGRGERAERAQSQAPLFNFAVLLIGFAIVGAALFELGSSIESGRRLSPVGARVENRTHHRTDAAGSWDGGAHRLEELLAGLQEAPMGTGAA